MVFLEGKAIADAILSVAASIFKYNNEAKRVKADRRDRIAEYFLEISETLEEAANTVERGDYPHGKCESLRIYAQELPDIIEDFVSVPKEISSPNARAVSFKDKRRGSVTNFV